MFRVSGRTSTKTGRAPRRTNAFAVDTNVKDGMITSSPGSKSSKSALISSACVQDVVKSAFRPPVARSSSSLAPLRIMTIARQVSASDSVGHIADLVAHEHWAVEWDSIAHACSFASRVGANPPPTVRGVPHPRIFCRLGSHTG